MVSFLYIYSYLFACLLALSLPNAGACLERLLKVVKSTPYTVMDVEVGIPDDKPAEGEPTKWGADEGTRLGDLEMQASALTRQLIQLVRLVRKRPDWLVQGQGAYSPISTAPWLFLLNCSSGLRIPQ